ncbi:MAG: PTS sugar transporter subunit IIA [Nitrospirota bacterium]
MSTIRDLLQNALVIEDLHADDKIGVIREFCTLLKQRGTIDHEEELVGMLLGRESLGSTGIGDGVAIPHAKVPLLAEMILAFGRSFHGVDFNSVDGKPVFLFFLVIAPEDCPGEHLKILSRISRILKNPLMRKQLREASNREALTKLICEEDSKYPQPSAAYHR